jgi:Zn-dependent protease with chaperone function
MDFFAHQEAARQRTSLLLFYFALAVAFLVAATYGAVMLVFLWQGDTFGLGKLPLWQPKIFGGAALGTLSLVFLGSLWRIIELRQGGAAVAQMLGGTLVTTAPADAEQQKLRNVVEEMAIASGTPVPEIYVLENELGINAFAAGHSISDAAVGVTRGCISRLNRGELQGVVAHEFSHILNGDMRLNIRLMGVLHGILCLYLIGRVLLRTRAGSSSSRKKDSNPLPLLGLLLMLIGSLGVLFGRLIQAAVSRQREFLADASAVQFTRDASGIAGALKKIGASTYGSKLEAVQARAASHMFFGNALSMAWFGLMATHPPLAERICRIEPAFDGNFPAIEEPEIPGELKRMASPPIPLSQIALMQLQCGATVPAGQLTQRVGETVHAKFAAGLLESLPAGLRAATGSSLSAAALTFALVYSEDSAVRGKQFAHLASVDGGLAKLAEQYADALARQDNRWRLMLLNLSLPALRTLSREQWQRFRPALEFVICCDEQVDLFEFVLKRVLERNIDAHFAPRQAAVVQYYSFQPLAKDCAVLLSALAHLGSSEETEVRRAFHEGAGRLPLRGALPLVPASGCGVRELDRALQRMAEAIPHIKKTLLNACAHTVSCDGGVQVEEAELLRAIAESLDCPIPPFIEGM